MSGKSPISHERTRTMVSRAMLLAASWLLAANAGWALDVQGHRGCRGLLPENTLPAFREAIALGVTTLELDVHGTRDRVLVVHHDASPSAKLCRRGDGTSAGKAPFSSRRYEEVARLDCGSRAAAGFPAQRTVPGARIPRLDEVLELARDAPYPVRVSIEVKLQKREQALPLTELAKLVVDALSRHGLAARAMVQSFDPELLVEIRRVAPELPRSLLVRGSGGFERWIDDGTATVLSPKFGKVTRESVAALQSRGVAVIPWTVNETEDIRRLIDWGIDGIISDYPDRVLAVLAERDADD